MHEILFFSGTFLKKGGNLIFKVIHSSSTNLFKEKVNLLFHQSYSFKPSSIRTNSPIYFLVLKGFGINHNLDAMQSFLKKYRGSPKHKIEIVK